MIAAAAAYENLLESQIVGPYPRPTDSKTPGVEPRYMFPSLPGDSDAG